jgi:MFS transporter, DHA1 family, multidrug resistance protein
MQHTSGRLGTLVIATRVEAAHPGLWRTRAIILCLAASCALMMIGFGISTPVFAKRLGELGSGVEALSFMTMASALAQCLLAPCTGIWADRFGRRPFVLLTLAGLAITHLAFLPAQSVSLLIVLRFVQGAVSVGFGPSVMGMLADLVPAHRRLPWVGVIMSGYATGFVFGPALGGLLFERWSFAAPFGVAALLTLVALLLVLLMVPETRPVSGRKQAPHVRRGTTFLAWRESVASLPQPFSLMATLLLLDFVAVLGLSFLEPQMVFYLYKTLALTPAHYGFVMSSYGLALVVGQAGLGRLGERLGRKQLIALGFLLTSALPLGLLLFHQLAPLILGALLAGLGSALITPALESSYLERTPEQHRSRMIGVRESVVSLGAVAGPLLLACSSRWLSPQRVFTVALLVALAAVILTLAALKLPGGPGPHGTERDTSERAALVFCTLSSLLEEVQVMRQPTSLLAESESTTDLTRRSPAALSAWH